MAEVEVAEPQPDLVWDDQVRGLLENGRGSCAVVDEGYDPASYYREPDRVDLVGNVMRHIAEDPLNNDRSQ
jgi:hypothetical protein